MSAILIALGLTILIMLLTWLWAVRINNYGIIDAVWSFSFFIHAGIYCINTNGYFYRKLLLLIMIGLWSLRLGYYLSKRIYGHHPIEDTRYAQLRSDYGDQFKLRFLVFFMYQAVSVSLLTIPFAFAFKNQNNSLSLFEMIGFTLGILSLLGETIADAQMNRFKSVSSNKGQVCNIGLWKYSRHPNYFFESCIWWSFFIFMLGTENLYWSIYAPLIILFLLLKVTGVPPSEEQSLKSRGDLYREYQKRTSMFVPWFPRKGG